MKSQTRGQLQHPLNWILVIFAGAFFLLLLITIARTMMSNNGVETVRTLHDVRSVIETSKANPGRATTYDFPRTITTCDRAFSLIISGQERMFAGQAIFAPASLKDTTTVWSQEYGLPSPITTATYIFPENLLLVFTDDVPLAVKDLFPVKKKTVSFSELATESFRGNNVVVISTEPLDNKKLREPANGIQLFLGTPPERLGDIQYYVYNNGFVRDGDPTSYLLQELLIGAVVAGTKQRYICGLDIIQKKTQLVSLLEQERAQKIIDNGIWPAECSVAYGKAITEYGILAATPFSDKETLYNARTGLFYASETLMRNGCPGVI